VDFQGTDEVRPSRRARRGQEVRSWTARRMKPVATVAGRGRRRKRRPSISASWSGVKEAWPAITGHGIGPLSSITPASPARQDPREGWQPIEGRGAGTPVARRAAQQPGPAQRGDAMATGTRHLLRVRHVITPRRRPPLVQRAPAKSPRPEALR
jgi:hypothetical protein